MNQIILKGIRDSDFSLGWLARNCSGLSRLKNIPQNPAQAPLNVIDIFANQASASAQNTNFNKFMTLG